MPAPLAVAGDKPTDGGFPLRGEDLRLGEAASTYLASPRSPRIDVSASESLADGSYEHSVAVGNTTM